MVDVSANPAFRGLFMKEVRVARESCLNGEDGSTRNGACPSYVAAAARVGKLNEAWIEMIGAYDASQDWEWPTGCWVKTNDSCPTGSEIRYKSYPEALLAFLKDNGYVTRNWIPPEARMRETIDGPTKPDWTT